MSANGMGPKGSGLKNPEYREQDMLGISLAVPAEFVDEAQSVVEISGVIKWFDASKGYGFIVPDGGWRDPVFLHVADWTAARRPERGMRVSFVASPDPNGGRHRARKIVVE